LLNGIELTCWHIRIKSTYVGGGIRPPDTTVDVAPVAAPSDQYHKWGISDKFSCIVQVTSVTAVTGLGHTFCAVTICIDSANAGLQLKEVTEDKQFSMLSGYQRFLDTILDHISVVAYFFGSSQTHA
jgi:hypothetical protein